MDLLRDSNQSKPNIQFDLDCYVEVLRGRDAMQFKLQWTNIDNLR